jgi:hypothetical protein
MSDNPASDPNELVQKLQAKVTEIRRLIDEGDPTEEKAKQIQKEIGCCEGFLGALLTCSKKMDGSSPPLQLGWHRDVGPSKAPVYLKGDGLSAHTAIIAQSGSGKSFMLGRLLEEIASKTLSRILILDPNSDFSRFGEVEKRAWTNFKCNFAEEDREVEFKRRWDRVGIICPSKRRWDPGRGCTNSQIVAIALSWQTLSERVKAWTLGISLSTHPDEYGVFQAIQSQAPSGTLDTWQQVMQSRTGQPKANLSTRIAKLQSSHIWRATGTAIQEWVEVLVRTDLTSRIVCLDLGSLDDLEEIYTTAGVALEALWEHARRAWTAALAAPADEERRCPVFVVIDEAHNIAPEQPTTGLARSVVDTLVRIAMEGRKYGLFLILVTQRPSRVNSNLLSQCDNLCLMKMSNLADVQLVQQRFGFVPPGWAERALTYKRGEMLVSGQFVDRPVEAIVAPRRTVEGGRSLKDSVWLKDPSPPEGKEAAPEEKASCRTESSAGESPS